MPSPVVNSLLLLGALHSLMEAKLFLREDSENIDGYQI